MGAGEDAAHVALVEHYGRLYAGLDLAAEDASRLARSERTSPGLVRGLTGAAQRNAEDWEREAASRRRQCAVVLDEAREVGVDDAEVNRMVAVLNNEGLMLARQIAAELPESH